MLSPTNLKLRVFISSVQKELADERMLLKVLLTSDPFLVRCTAPKLFEKYPVSLRPDDRAYLKILEKCQIYVLIIGKEYGANEGKSATHLEYDLAQKLKLPTLVCVKGDHLFERDKKEKEFFNLVCEDGHTYSRFQSHGELYEKARERLIEHIKESYDLEPSKEETAIGKANVSAASEFERERIADRTVSDLVKSQMAILAESINPERYGSLKASERDQLLLERGYLWFHSNINTLRPTAAGLLLLGKDPTTMYTHTRIQLDFYPGVNHDTEAVIAESIRANIPDAIEQVVATIRKNTRKTPRVVGLKRVELSEYPEVALREAVVNALAHRSYDDSTQHVIIEVFFDRIVVTNPGGPVGDPSLKKLEIGKARSRSRNPLISQGLVFLKLMEERGTGIRRMRKAMLDYGLDMPHIAVDDDYFILTLPGPGEKLDRIKAPYSIEHEIPKSLVETLNKRQLQILKTVIDKGSITNRDVQEALKVVRDTAHRDLSILCEIGLLTKKGKGRATHYIPAVPED